MKLHTSPAGNLNLFTAYGDGYVAVNRVNHAHNLIVQPDRLTEGWTTVTPEQLGPEEIEYLAALPCEIILLGTGKRQRFPDQRLMIRLAQCGKGIEFMDIQAACRTYNILASEGRQVAAALLFD